MLRAQEIVQIIDLLEYMHVSMLGYVVVDLETGEKKLSIVKLR